ncbi:unnamed protein product [Gordionus sp. m RMFG-2023]
MQKLLIREVYLEAHVDPLLVSYIEAHGTGTQAGDPQECNSLADFFCKNRKLPLLIGSVKSNMGHPEPASGLASLLKIIISMEEGIIPPNLHYNEPNPNIPALVAGQLKVVTEMTPWSGGYIALNNFGFGGSNVHAIFHSNQSHNPTQNYISNLPKLFITSGRTEEAVGKMLSFMNSHPNDHYLYNMVEELSDTNPSSHPFRGFNILGTESHQEIKKQMPNKRPLWYIFSGMGTQWVAMGKAMMAFNTFSNSIFKSANILKQFEIDLISILSTNDSEILENTLNSFVSVAAIQVGLVDLLNEMGLKPDGLIGHSVGELGCGYADGGFTAEEMVLAAYWRGKCIQDAKLAPGGMAAVGLTWKEAKEMCPPGIVPACHNAEDTVTISGPKLDVEKFVDNMKKEGIFAKEVNSAGVAFHSYFMKPIGPILKSALDKVIKQPKLRSSKWISTSIPEDSWNSDLAKFCSSDYHANNLCNPVLFQEALKHIPSNAVTVEIAPHCLLQSILKRSLSQDCSFVSLMKKGHEDNVMYFLENLGRLYSFGCDLDIRKLYPPITYPVPKGTPMISPHLIWNHSDSWDVPTYKHFDAVLVSESGGGSSLVYKFDATTKVDEFLFGHNIDGRTLYPATGYIELAWRALAKKMKKDFLDLPIIIENFQIHRATILTKTTNTRFEVNILPYSNNFEIIENGAIVASGIIQSSTDELEIKKVDSVKFKDDFSLETNDIYKELSLRGYEYFDEFRGVKEFNYLGKSRLSWTGNWITFLDTILQSQILNTNDRSLYVPNRIKLMKINPHLHSQRSKDNIIDCFYDEILNKTYAGGVEMFGLHTSAISRRQHHSTPIIEKYEFVPYSSDGVPKNVTMKMVQYKEACEQLIGKGLRKFISSPDSLPNRDKYNTILNNIPPADLLKPDQKLLSIDGNDQFILNYITELFNLPLTNQLHQNVLKIYTSAKVNLFKDKLVSLLLDESYLKPFLDLVIENCFNNKLKAIEFNAPSDPLIVTAYTSMNRQPQTKLNFCAFGPNGEDLQIILNDRTNKNAIKSFEYDIIKNPNFENMPPELLATDYDLVLANNVLHKCVDLEKTLKQIYSLLKPGGFCLVHETTDNFIINFTLDVLVEEMPTPTEVFESKRRKLGFYYEKKDWIELFSKFGFNLISSVSDNCMSSLYLIRKKSMVPLKHKIITVNETPGYNWVDTVRDAMYKNTENVSEENRIWLYTSSPNTGLVGFVNCLKQEPVGSIIRLIVDYNKALDASSLNVKSPKFMQLTNTDLFTNVWLNGKWGSYRHIILNNDNMMIDCEYAFVNCLKKGDLTSLVWMKSDLNPVNYPPSQKELCTVFYSALNFRDIMLATGKLSPNAIPGNFSPQDCLLGMEFSGLNSKGQQIMGILPAKGLATIVDVDPKFTWDLPKSWSLRDAATIPVVYATAYYSLIVRGGLKKGESVLIHSGSGGVGQAAISIALSLNCTVYTSVGSLIKRTNLKTRFPQLKDDNFCNSRDLSFEDHVCKMTKGQGVDVILNSLSDEKLQASVRLLAKHGRFLEIGKFDLSNNSSLGMAIFLKNVSFHGILLDSLFESDNDDWKLVHDMVDKGIKTGVVKPLDSMIFTPDKIEEAFRYMAKGKHTGKVLIKIRENEKLNEHISFKALPKNQFNSNDVYLITGGLGGFGLEMTEWIIQKGARKIVLTSRSGVTNGYQSSRIRYWESLGAKILISKLNISIAHDVDLLMKKIQILGKLDGIFHLAAVLRDALFENQSINNFIDVSTPKALGVLNLDNITRSLFPTMSYFVVFSSISCGRGNMGQTNYGYANSVMERICECRRKDGYSGLAIEWGAIGDVGLIMETMNGNETVVGGTLPQRINSCLDTLDLLLSSSHPIISSYVLAEKGGNTSQTQSKINVIDAIAHILGIKDIGSVNQETSLADLGLDSLMGVEIKQTLEREYEIVLSIKEIRQLTFNKMKNLMLNSSNDDLNLNVNLNNQPPPSEILSPTIGLELIMRRYNINELVPKETVVYFNTDINKVPIFFIHPIEGSLVSLSNIIKLLNQPVIGFQCSKEVCQDSVEEMAEFYIRKMLEIKKDGPYIICAYSFGATIAFEIALQLQVKGIKIKDLIFLDGSHSFVTSHTQYHLSKLTHGSDIEKYAEIMVAFVLLFVGSDYIKLKEKFSLLTTAEDIQRVAINRLMVTNLFPDQTDLEFCAQYFCQKLRICDKYLPKGDYKGDITLIRVKDADEILGDDYGLSSVCTGKIDIKYTEGDHETMLIGDNGYKVVNLLHKSLSHS